MEQYIVFATLFLALFLFIWGKIRHDIVAVICLLVLVIFGIVSPESAFEGFAHPAVITVAAVLIVSQGLQNSGLIEVIGKWILKIGENRTLQILALTGLVCFASAFMNNVGALAVMMPVAIHIAKKHSLSPSFLLMPLAFGSLLGGMTTLIGTPPNIIIASFRREVLGQSFTMFDFAPVGVGLTVAGLAFITLIGWRLLPMREARGRSKDRFNIEDYITEVRITQDSNLVGTSMGDIKKVVNADIQILGLIRNKHLIDTPRLTEVFVADDILIIEADSVHLKEFVEKSRCKLVGGQQLRKQAVGSEEVSTVEVVVTAESPILEQTASSLSLRTHYGVNLLALARQEKKYLKRLDRTEFKAGDVLLLQGRTQKIDNAIQDMGCLPLADRGFTIGKPKNIILALVIFGLAITTVVTGILKVQIAFTFAATLMVLTKVMSPREIYESIDWPVIVLLGAMLPVGAALETTGGANLIAEQVINSGDFLPAWGILTLLLAVTMLLTGLINNAATVILMAPISISVAQGIEASPDPFLMTIAVGASSAFLTPIGHQSNTLVMGPGGYKFSDYLRMGVPLSILIILISVPLILIFWPL
ncbi:MAG: SLC13 family permease [Saprospiraceae bacterium]|nr:SLC13 family permease [Saprospiraceae bacterium]